MLHNLCLVMLGRAADELTDAQRAKICQVFTLYAQVFPQMLHAG